MMKEETYSIANLYIDERYLDELCQYVQQSSIIQLKTLLDTLTDPYEYLTIIIRYDQNQLNLLMLACLQGNNKIVEFLLNYGYAKDQLEQQGDIIFNNGQRIQGANALYCACFQGHFYIAQILIELDQASVNKGTDDHLSYPLLLQATIKNRLDIVRFLLENQYSDVNKTRSFDSKQRTALICAAYSNHSAIVEYLLNHGADVYSISSSVSLSDTALNCAVLNQSLEVFCLLWKADAAPKSMETPYKHLLTLVVKHHSYNIMNFLLEQSFCTPDDLEWSIVSELSNLSRLETIQTLSPFLEISLKQRQSMGLPKLTQPPKSIYDHYQECQTVDELKAIVNDHERIIIEFLLIQERLYSTRQRQIFTNGLKDYIQRLASAGKLEQTFDVCLYFIEIDQGASSIFLLVWILCRMMSSQQKVSVNRFLQTASFALQPCYNQSRETDVNNALFLVIIASKILEQHDISIVERQSIYRWINNLCRLRPTTETGETLLHLCVNQRTSNNLTFRSSETTPHIQFPNRSALQLLLIYGRNSLDINARTRYGNTPLHIVCQNTPDPTIIEILNNAECHIDCVNNQNKTPLDYLTNPQIIRILQPTPRPTALKCLCARLIGETYTNIDTFQLLNSSLQKFIGLHSRSSNNCFSW
ncbi:unnamed protein product [Adineta steineri]|uniref:Ankyrin repeat protein n=1 Tax=Adineta steineri TaxID=433720 RepID=A0A814QLH8_9BILA|nr:unnamed protein product [Adineta steineri]CAF1405126.1 unnamed protein product [Adineta steineri]